MEMTGQLEPMYTVEEVAALFRVGKQTIYRMVKRGAIPGVVKIAGNVRFLRPAIEQFVRESSLGFVNDSESNPGGATDQQQTP